MVVADKCKRCRGMMTPFVDKEEPICIVCGWVNYKHDPLPIPTQHGQGRPRGYTRNGKIRLD